MKTGRYEAILDRRGQPRVLTAVLTTALATALLLTVGASSSSGSGTARPASGLVPSPAAQPGTIARTEGGITARVMPGVVIIATGLRYNSEAAAGTGMVINPDGLVLTNNHVIEDATSISATVAGKTYQARVVGYDKTGDIALIQLLGAAKLRVVPIGNSSQVKVGQTVIAMGNAGGHAAVITSPGKVTKLNQTIMASDQVGTLGSETLHGMMQADAGLVAGDSGGPLSSTTGVIGMDTAANNVGQRAVGFAIPINTALSVAGQIAAGNASSAITVGYPPFLGTFVGTGPDPDPLDQAQPAVPQSSAPDPPPPSCYTSNANLTLPAHTAPVTSGVLVQGVICASPVAQAGMTAGAVITAVNGQHVGSPDSLSHVIGRFRPGDTVSVSWVAASGARTTSRVRLTAGPPD